MYLVSVSVSPWPTSALTVTRARSSKLSLSVTVPSGPSTSWSIPAAIRRALARVLCTRTARSSEVPWYSETRGEARIAAARGSALRVGTSSLATSSDCTTIRVSPSSGLTS